MTASEHLSPQEFGFTKDSGGRPPIAKNPQTPAEKGKKGAHSRKSKYAKGSKN